MNVFVNWQFVGWVDVNGNPTVVKRVGRWGDGEMGRWGDGEMGRWGDGEMGRWGDGEMGRWGDGVC
ncbi:MAG: hypothetical protein F6K23_08990 [Okeania sp. SIO2C9]|uniref:hypothetical protein n=1 Tax=Okeania sp. SIO2C9 TaxID=2607791 RepID=UPI0013C217A5|nr:hypothetical protein [Okeania sp. SIO2C9]NEQ73198.1 hypothetical protein [Okeania sp. SIO2C9]